MRKKIIIVSLLLLIVPTVIFAAFSPATLTDGLHRVVASTQAQAQYLFSLGYKLETKVGSLTGPIINSNFLTVGGITEYYWSTSLKTATTTICAIKSPAATSTMVFGSLSFTKGTTTAATLTMAQATTAYATTTAIGSQFVLAANNLGTMVASTTNGAPYIQFAPNTYFVVGLQSSTAVTNLAETGKCQAIFRVTN